MAHVVREFYIIDTHSCEQFSICSSLIRKLPTKQNKDEHPKRPDIRWPRVIRLLHENLRRHIRRRPAVDLLPLIIRHPNTKPEINNLHDQLPVFVLFEEDVLQLDIAVVDLVRVEVRDAFHQLVENLGLVGDGVLFGPPARA